MARTGAVIGEHNSPLGIHHSINYFNTGLKLYADAEQLLRCPLHSFIVRNETIYCYTINRHKKLQRCKNKYVYLYQARNLC